MYQYCVFITILIGQGVGAFLECGRNGHLVEMANGNLTCKPCRHCEKGFGLSVVCGNTEAVKEQEIFCKLCAMGKTFSSDQGTGRCVDCSSCGLNEIEIRPCSRTYDRLCKCADGFYRNPGTSLCEDECCYCDNRALVQEECKYLPNGKNCDSIKNDGKCFITQPPSPISVQESTSAFERTTPKIDDSNSINMYVAIGGSALVALVVCLLIWFCRKYIKRYCLQKKNTAKTSADVDDAIPLTNSEKTLNVDDYRVNLNVAESEHSTSSESSQRLRKRLISLDSMYAKERQECKSSCEQVFRDEMFFQLHGHVLINIQTAFLDSPSWKDDMNTCRTIFKLTYNDDPVVFWNSLKAKYPDLPCKVLVYILNYIGRNDVVNIMHTEMHQN